MSIDHLWWIMKPYLMVAFIVIVPTVFVIWVARRRASATRNPVIEAEYLRAGFEVGSSWVHGGRVVKGALRGMPFVLTAMPGASHTPAMTVISLKRTPGTRFNVVRFSSRDSSGQDILETLFPDAKAREAVRSLFQQGFDTVGARGANLSAIRHHEAGLLDLASLNAALEQLVVLRTLSEP